MPCSILQIDNYFLVVLLDVEVLGAGRAFETMATNLGQVFSIQNHTSVPVHETGYLRRPELVNSGDNLLLSTSRLDEIDVISLQVALKLIKAGADIFPMAFGSADDDLPVLVDFT